MRTRREAAGLFTTLPPDFLSSLVALANFVRLSLQKAAHMRCVEEIRVRSGLDDNSIARNHWKTVPQGLKPSLLWLFTARLTPCPSCNELPAKLQPLGRNGFFQGYILLTGSHIPWLQIQEEQAGNGDGNTEAGEQADGLMRE